MVQKFEFLKTELEGAYLIKPFIATDSRGAFIKDYSKEVFEANGINHDLVEVFYTQSQPGVMRGMHFQRVKEQVKLVRCVKGMVYDVIVDLRPDSPTFGQWRGFDLTGENMNCLLVPQYSHSICPLTNGAPQLRQFVFFHAGGSYSSSSGNSPIHFPSA